MLGNCIHYILDRIVKGVQVGGQKTQANSKQEKKPVKEEAEDRGENLWQENMPRAHPILWLSLSICPFAFPSLIGGGYKHYFG